MLGHFSLPFTQRLAQNAFDEEEKQVPSVEDGDGQEVQDPEVDAEQRDQEDHVGRTLRRGFTGNLGDGQRPADVLARNVAHDHLVEADDGEFAPFPGCLKAVVQRRNGSAGLHQGAIRAGDADLPDLNGLPVDGGGFCRGRDR